MFIIIISLLAAGARAAECDTLAKYWVSAPYEAERIGKDGETTTLANLSATLTITSQSGCAFEGINSWTNGQIGGKETVAGIIDSETEITMLELGEPPAGGSTARIDATLETNGLMRWRYTGQGAAADDRWVTVFDADFAPDAAPAVAEKDCLDISGTWKSNATYYYRLYEDGTREKVGPLYNTLTLTMASDCLVSGTNTWDNGVANGTEVVAGVVHANTSRDGPYYTSAATLVEMGGMYVDGRMEVNFDCALDCDTMQLHFIGQGKEGYGVLFDSYLGKGEGPTVAPPDCEWVNNLVGTYTASGFDIFRVPGPPLTDVSMTMEILGRDGCTFWGHAGNIGDGIPGTPLLGLIPWYELDFDLTADGGMNRSTAIVLATASILQIGHVCVNTSAIDADCDVCGEVCLNTSAVVDAQFTLSRFTDEGTVKWHYVGTADDGQNAEVFDAVFAKNSDATAAPTTTPGSDGAAGRSVGFLVALAAAAAAL